jgi:hypothetical protein
MSDDILHELKADWMECACYEGSLSVDREVIDQAAAEIERLRAERDTLLLDAREFVRWFNRHYPDPSRHPDHPWCEINNRLMAHADTLAALNSGLALEGGR